MLKFIFKSSVIGCIIYASSAMAQAPTSCSGGGSSSSPITLNNGSACYSQPDEMQMTFYKIYLCTSAPTAPTTSTQININACTQIFNNTGGAIGVLNSSTASSPPKLTGNTINGIPLTNGAQYTHTYIEFAPSQVIKTTKKFNVNQTGADGSTGAYCWTGSGNMYVKASSLPSTASSCGTSYTAGGNVTNLLNSLGGSGAFSATAAFTNAGSGQDVSLNAYLMDSTYKLPATGAADSMGSVVTLAAVYPLATPIIYNSSTQDGLITSLNFSWGAEIFRQSGTTFFMGGPLTVKFTSHCKSQGSC